MPKPWEDYGGTAEDEVDPTTGEAPEPVAAPEAEAPADPAAAPEAADPADVPGEMAAQDSTPTAGQPWTDFGGAPDEGDGLTGTVTDETPWYTSTSGQMVDKDGHPVDAQGNRTDAEPPSDPTSNAVSAFGQGALSGLTRGFDDEILSGISAAAAAPFSEKSVGDLYGEMVARERADKENMFNEHPLAYGAGFLPGSALGLGKIGMAETALGRMAQAGALGGAEGAVSGAGNADGDSMLSGAGWGGLLGAVGGAALAPVASGVANVAGRIYRKVRPDNSLNSGLGELAARAPQTPDDIAAMRAEQQRFADAGVPARLIDVGDERVRGVARDAASKMTPGRVAVTKHSNEVYADAGDRVAAQANRHISQQPGTARQLGHQIKDEQTALGPQFDAVRNEPVQLTPEIVRSLDTADGRSALRTASRLMTPDEQESINKLISAMTLSRKLGSPEEQAAKLFPAFNGMGAAAKAAMLTQMTQQGMIKDPMATARLTVDIADKFSRILVNKAQENPALLRVAGEYADTVRGAARQQHPDYDEALNQFEAQAGVGNAARGEGKFADTKFMNTPPDEYARGVGMASPDPVEPVSGSAPISEADALRMRARDEIRDQATAGNGAGAAGVARQVARGSKTYGQGARNEALLGPDAARQLEGGMEAEVNRVDNTRYIDPRTGAQTQGRAQDAIVDGFADTVGNVATGGKWGVVRAAAKWLKQGGIRNIDAERLARDSISEDPARVTAAIDYLESKGMAHDRAQRFVSIYGGALAGRAAGAAQTTASPAPPPNSVRSLMTRPTMVGEHK